MNIKNIRAPQARVESMDINHLDIISYGANNLYPQEILAIVASSETGTTCLKRYKEFLQGNGFANGTLAESVVNSDLDTLNDVLHKVAEDMGNYNGFAIHLNYNLLAQITEVHHVPFEYCRLGQEDEKGNIHHIAVFPDWSGQKHRGGKPLRVSKENIDYIDIFNPLQETVYTQIAQAGGISEYKGQILWVSGAGKFEYPQTVYDAAITQLSIEEGVGNIAYKNARNGFHMGGMLIVKRGQDAENENYEDNNTSIEQTITEGSSDIHAGNIAVCSVEYNEDKPEFVPFRSANYDREFITTTDTACEKIYAVFGQEAFHRIRKGSVGFATDILTDAFRLYNSSTQGARHTIERAFGRVFKHWHQALPLFDFTIMPLDVEIKTKDINE